MVIGTSIAGGVVGSVHGLMWNSLRHSLNGLVPDSVKVLAIDAVWTPVNETIIEIHTHTWT